MRSVTISTRTSESERTMRTRPGQPPPVPTLTKIVATVGPCSSSPDVIGRLIEAGVSVFRLNFGHGTLEEHAARVETIRGVAAALDRPTAIMADLQGPKIRVRRMADDQVHLEPGSTVIMQRDAVADAPVGEDGSVRLSTTYDGLVDDVRHGERVLIDDGAIRLLVVEKRPDEVVCTVTHGGSVQTGKGVNLPETALGVATITERDWHHVRWSIEHDIDFLALSFVRSADDVHELRTGIAQIASELGRKVFRIPVIAKIEVPEALEEIESIVDASDAIMVARGDLGVEMDLAEVPVIQRHLLGISQAHGKPCIVATQMLQSMIDQPAPTRAEANDVASAIFDHVDAVMLSGETAVGRYPVVTVEHMRRIAERAESHLRTQPPVPSAPARLVESRVLTAALAHGVHTIAQDIGARCIVVWSEGGGSARYLSQNNFYVPIIAVTSCERAARQMQLLRGVTPRRFDVPAGLGAFTRTIDRLLQSEGWATRGEPCILVAGEPLGKAGVTNSLAIHIVDDPGSGFYSELS